MLENYNERPSILDEPLAQMIEEREDDFEGT